jgi:hypothetical protein
LTAQAIAPPVVATTFGPVRVGHLLGFAIVLVAAYLVGPQVLLTACAGVLLWVLATSPAERALALVLPIAFRLAFALGAFAFEPPVQIVDLGHRGVNPFTLFLDQDLWWARYLVAYPSIAVMDQWGMRFADAFALYCTALLPITATVLLASVRTSRRLDERAAFLVGLGFAVVVAAIATQMNGRLIPAHIGMGVIVLAQARIVAARAVGMREGVMLVVGLVLSHMTSGTGLVAYAVVIACGALIMAIGIDRLRMAALLWFLSAMFAPLLYRDLLKNLDFYGGGPAAIVTMLDHGPGTFLRRMPIVIPLALAAVGVVLAVLWRLRRRLLAIPRPLWPAVVAIPVTSVGGLYGYSTLSMGLPVLLLLAMTAVLSWSDRRHVA